MSDTQQVHDGADELTLQELFDQYGSRWSVRAWWNDEGLYGAKMGPFTINAYRWFDGRLRIAWSWNWSQFGYEHILFGGKLT